MPNSEARKARMRLPRLTYIQACDRWPSVTRRKRVTPQQLDRLQSKTSNDRECSRDNHCDLRRSSMQKNHSGRATSSKSAMSAVTFGRTIYASQGLTSFNCARSCNEYSVAFCRADGVYLTCRKTQCWQVDTVERAHWQESEHRFR